MKPQTAKMATQSHKPHYKFYLLITAIILFCAGCKKDTGLLVNTNKTNLTEQEKLLVGKWILTKTETYEILHTDSVGLIQCSLISSINSLYNCQIKFTGTYNGTGTIGACYTTNTFKWYINEKTKLQIQNGVCYDITYLNTDSFAVATIYTKDILKLKDIFYYKIN